jgi:hypothetical protein
MDEEHAPVRASGLRVGRQRLEREEVEEEASVGGERREEEVGVAGGVVGTVPGGILELDDPRARPRPAAPARRSRTPFTGVSNEDV